MYTFAPIILYLLYWHICGIPNCMASGDLIPTQRLLVNDDRGSSGGPLLVVDVTLSFFDERHNNIKAMFSGMIAITVMDSWQIICHEAFETDDEEAFCDYDVIYVLWSLRCCNPFLKHRLISRHFRPAFFFRIGHRRGLSSQQTQECLRSNQG